MKKNLLLLIPMLLILAPRPVLGCTIPVFRYALEKWDLTPYDVVVYHRGPLPAELQTALKPWANALKKINLDLTIVDLDGKVDKKYAKWHKEFGKDAKTPWMLVRSRSANAVDAPAWSGPCTAANLNNLVDSPLRRAILAHLTRGSSMVYVLMTSADAKADRALYDMTLKELQGLEKKIKLPEQVKEGPQIKLPLPLKVSLPLLVLDRNDPAEALFVQLLLGTEDDLAKKKGPILFPIFGRGRALASLYEKDLTPQVIVAATSFLCKECSCQVKELNPGVDLLMLADWEAHFAAMFKGRQPVPMPKVLPTALPTRVVRP
ncbi:MAG: hypothetical protein HYX68_05995 [Planctomycetes bacterium]|nr:hypothetical protein [Planctomycetota bacterium]